MSNANDGFVEVNEKNPIYEPCIYKNEQGDTVTKTVSDNSYMVGYYLGMKEIQVKGKNSIIHEFQLKMVGNEADLSEPAKEGDRISMWGRLTLNELLIKHVAIGVLCEIRWTGKIKAKSGDSAYHTFKLRVNTSDTLASAVTSSPQQPASPAATAPQTSAPVANQAEKLADEDDDLPF